MQGKPTDVVGRRVGAFLIDALIVGAINIGLWYAMTVEVDCFGTVFLELNGVCRAFEDNSALGLYSLLTIAIGFLYFGVLQGLTGKTAGKAALGIKVVDERGGTPGVGRATVRWIVAIVDSFPWIIPYLVGFILALTSERNQRLGDMAAKTFVVDRNADSPFAVGPGAGQPAFGAPPQYGQPQYGQPPQYGQAPYGQQPQYAPQPQAAPSNAPKADWYPDPRGQARLRYWDGQSWTEHTSA